MMLISNSPDFTLSQIFGNFSSVAIVGNSPKLTSQSFGTDIDKHEIVIRLNDGRVDTFEEHAGTRTSLRFVGWPIKKRFFEFFENLKEESLICTRAQNQKILESLGWKREVAYYGHHSHVVRTAFAKLNQLLPLGEIPEKNPRSGIVVLSLLTDAMRRGAEISLYGFETDERQSGALHFYKDDIQMASEISNWENYHCPMAYEFNAIKKLSQNSFLKVY